MEEKRKVKTSLAVILILILLVSLFISIYYIYIQNQKVIALEKDAIRTAAIIREINEKAQATENNTKISYIMPVISGIGEKITGDRYSGDYELEDEIKLYRYTKGDGYEYFDIEYTIMGKDNRTLKIVNNTTNKRRPRSHRQKTCSQRVCGARAYR